METTNDTLWTISELAAQSAHVLSEASVDQASGRVTDVPSTRTIRYYSTHGLLDRPAEFRGRTALYGRRHLLQLVAIKRLQARGTPLTVIQDRIAGATDAELEELAAMPESVGSRAKDAAPQKKSSRRADFWAQGDLPEPQANVSARSASAVPAVKLADGVVLMLADAQRELYDDDLRAIEVAAQPLLKLLNSRNITGGH